MLQLTCGAISGAIEAAATYPTEYIKTQLQLQSKAGKTQGPIECAVQTVKTKGVRGLYKGLSAMIIGNSAKAGVRFVAYEQYSRAIARFMGEEGKKSGKNMMLSGLFAGMTEAALVVTPSETIKTKLIDDQNSKSPRFRGLSHATSTVFKEEGLRGIYRGLIPVMMRQGANQAVRFSTYGMLKDYIGKLYPQDATGKAITPWYVSFLSGVVAGVAVVYSTMPLDVLKTKMQSLAGAQKYGSTLNCIRVVFKEEGLKAFWKGATPRLGRLMFSGAIVFTSYEQLMKIADSLGMIQ